MATKSILPKSLITIGNQAFEGCTSLNVKLSNNLTSIGSRAFYNTTSLKTFDIPDSVKSIGSYAFYSSGNNVDKSAEEMPYDAEIDYLKGSVSQYIDTGITAKNTIGVELEVTVLPNLNIWFGIRPNTSSTNSFGLWLQTYPNKFISMYNNRVTFTSEKSLVEGQKVKIKCETGKVYVQPSDVLELSLCYNKPELCNYYCNHECPIGQKYVPEVKMEGIEATVLKMISSSLYDNNSILVMFISLLGSSTCLPSRAYSYSFFPVTFTAEQIGVVWILVPRNELRVSFICCSVTL